MKGLEQVSTDGHNIRPFHKALMNIRVPQDPNATGLHEPTTLESQTCLNRRNILYSRGLPRVSLESFEHLSEVGSRQRLGGGETVRGRASGGIHRGQCLAQLCRNACLVIQRRQRNTLIQYLGVVHRRVKSTLHKIGQWLNKRRRLNEMEEITWEYARSGSKDTEASAADLFVKSSGNYGNSIQIRPGRRDKNIASKDAVAGSTRRVLAQQRVCARYPFSDVVDG